MIFPKDLMYTKTHEWVKRDGDECIVGVTEYAQKELSDVVYVELPNIGRDVTAAEAICVVESVKAAFDIYAPVSGSVTDVNSTLETDPALVNSDCYKSGWFFKISAKDKNAFSSLMDAAAYTQHVQDSAH
jgi:glycine cleavage system H protein